MFNTSPKICSSEQYDNFIPYPCNKRAFCRIICCFSVCLPLTFVNVGLISYVVTEIIKSYIFQENSFVIYNITYVIGEILLLINIL